MTGRRTLWRINTLQGWRMEGGAQEGRRNGVEEEEDETESSDDTEWAGDDYTVKMMTDDKRRRWPGVKEGSKAKNVHYVSKKEGKVKKPRWVKMKVGGVEMDLFSDTGSRFTIIIPELYRDSMGKLEEADCNLRAWGADTYLDVKGMFRTRLTTKKGARKDTVVYVVGGTRPKPLLGDTDAENLCIIVFRAEGREATKEEREGKAEEKVNKVKEGKEHKGRSILSRLRRAGKIFKTEKPQPKALRAQCSLTRSVS